MNAACTAAATCLALSWGVWAGTGECLPVQAKPGVEFAPALRGTPFNCALVEAGGELAVIGAEPSEQREPVRPRPFAEWSRKARSPVVAISDGRWPGIRVTDEATATPSSEPWIDSNTWMIRSARAWSGSRPVWLTHLAPPGVTEVNCLRALADAAVAGGHWAPPLEAVLRWPSLARWARFFLEQARRTEFVPSGGLAIVQDSTEQDPVTPGEYLNLIARRGIPYQVIERPDLRLEALAAGRALLWACLSPPGAAEREILKACTARGGAVIATGDALDPAELARDVLDRIGYDNLEVRVYNAPSVMSYALEARDGQRLVHLINYATATAEGVRLRVHGRFRRATLISPDEAPRALVLRTTGGKSEVSNLKIPVYAGVLWEGDEHVSQP